MLSQTSPIVTTKAEMNDKRVKLFHIEGVTDATGIGEAEAKIPGTFNGTDGWTPSPSTGKPANGRYVYEAACIFQTPTYGDRVLDVKIVDRDNVLGAGVGYVVASYVDDEAAIQNQGWRTGAGAVRLSSDSNPAFLPSGLYLVVRVQKDTAVVDRFTVNFKWSKYGA